MNTENTAGVPPRIYGRIGNAEGDKVIICESHPHIDFWILNESFGICNRCGIANPIADFTMVHPSDACQVCGSKKDRRSGSYKRDDIRKDATAGVVRLEPEPEEYVRQEIAELNARAGIDSLPYPLSGNINQLNTWQRPSWPLTLIVIAGCIALLVVVVSLLV